MDQRLRAAAIAVLVLTASGLTGCGRQYYRTRADQEVDLLIAEKSNDPRWALPGFTVEMDPRSRYYDPYDPDTPPMPPDDPASHRYMHYVDGKPAWPHWDEYGFRAQLENPCWRERLAEYVPMDAEGHIILTLDSALQLALIHSPSYQQQLETLYLSALDVSAERFRFDTQFFAGNDTFFTHLGGRRSAAGERNTLETSSDFQVRKRFATAGELLVGFANSMVWQFAGPDTNTSLSILNFSLVQPLLRGAGRDIALEQLTIVERALLANLRAFQRYRQGFFTSVAVGQLGVAGPQRRGGFFGGTGLTGFTGQGSGGFGGVGGATGFGRAGFGGVGVGGGGAGAGFAGGGAGAVGGFVGLLQRLQEIRNTRASLDAQLRTLALLEAFVQAGVIDLTQVDQFRQSIETERANLLQTENSLESALDDYKTGTLGLPPDLEVTLDDNLIRQFQFIDPLIADLQSAIIDYQDRLGELPDQPTPQDVQVVLQRAGELQQAIGNHFAAVRRDLEAMLPGLRERALSLSATERELLERDEQQLFAAFQELEQRFMRVSGELDQIAAQTAVRAPRLTLDQLVIWNRGLLTLSQELSLVQARARLEAVSLVPVELEPETAFVIAQLNRLDLMNNRADLVDTWRLIQFNADALQSNLGVVFSGDVQTIGDNPFRFRGPTGTLRAGLTFDAPFTRLLERNNFRQVLIDYQRDRRQFIQFHDSIYQTLRELLRQSEQLRVNLEIQRRATAIAIRRVDLTREVLNEPVPPPQPGQPVAQFGPTAALNLLTALSDLRNTQNNFMSVWLNYYATRMLLMRELGLLELDERGMWIDQPVDFSQYSSGAVEELPPAVPLEWIQEPVPQQ